MNSVEPTRKTMVVNVVSLLTYFCSVYNCKKRFMTRFFYSFKMCIFCMWTRSKMKIIINPCLLGNSYIIKLNKKLLSSLSLSLSVGLLTLSSLSWSAFTRPVYSCGQHGPCNMSAARMVSHRRRSQNHVVRLVLFAKSVTHAWPVCLQLRATAACCWRRAACSSWSTFTHTHRRTETSDCWPRASWRACGATEPARDSQRSQSQAAARRRSNLAEVKSDSHEVVLLKCLM